MQANWWHPDQFLKRRPNLLARQSIIKAIRKYFEGQDFAEVDTPVLQVCPVMDAHIRGFATDLVHADGSPDCRLYLQTSPEFSMKKLLVAGVERLYQICPVFRNGEDSPRHVPEFRMLEWYRAGADYRDIMQDCMSLLTCVADHCHIQGFHYKGVSCDPRKNWEVISVPEAFDKYAQIDLDACLDDRDALARAARDKNVSIRKNDNWEDIFFAVMDRHIEPELGRESPAILYDYPVSMASLSTPSRSDPRYAERFELYVCGLELANAFSELTDAAEQRRRFKQEMDKKEDIYGERYPVDEEFLQALEHGMPTAGGIALGVDRLVMLACGAESIHEVLWCPPPR